MKQEHRNYRLTKWFLVFGLMVALVLIFTGCECGTTPPLVQVKIAFVSDRDGNWEIYVMDADGSNPTSLTNNPADDFFPAWSP